MTQDIKQRVAKVQGMFPERDYPTVYNLIKELKEREKKLVIAMENTIEDNLYLADGDNCTLIKLITVLKELGINPTNGDV